MLFTIIMLSLLYTKNVDPHHFDTDPGSALLKNGFGSGSVLKLFFFLNFAAKLIFILLGLIRYFIMAIKQNNKIRIIVIIS